MLQTVSSWFRLWMSKEERIAGSETALATFSIEVCGSEGQLGPRTLDVEI
jgi:hypothetical protein